MSEVALRALVVEDDRIWQEILAEALADCGLAVDIAASLDRALPQLSERKPCLVVADLSLDEGDHHNQDGLTVLDTVRQFDPGCVMVLLTGHATVELAVSVLTEHGAYTCLRKETFNRRHFRELVARALDIIRSRNGNGASANAVSPGDGAAAGAELSRLTEREREVLDLVARGLTNKEIAHELVITSNTVKRHLQAIFEKLGVRTRAGAAAAAIRARSRGI